MHQFYQNADQGNSYTQMNSLLKNFESAQNEQVMTPQPHQKTRKKIDFLQKNNEKLLPMGRRNRAVYTRNLVRSSQLYGRSSKKSKQDMKLFNSESFTSELQSKSFETRQKVVLLGESKLQKSGNLLINEMSHEVL